jgi:hypothetical protein
MRKLFLALTSATTLLLVALTTPLAAQEQHWLFMTHATFYADLTQQPIDPQVFVRDGGAAQGTDGSNIQHLAGLRAASLASDDRTSQLFNANGKPLGFNFGKWLGAGGTVDVTTAGAGDRLHLGFVALKESGHYGLFSLTPGTGALLPLDGSGTTNTFTTTPLGTADLSVTTTYHLSATDRIFLVYSSDGLDHGAQPGTPGIDSHAQMIMRIREI